MTKISALNETEIQKLENIAMSMRRNIISMVSNAKSGHIGGALSSADILATLYFKCMNISKDMLNTPEWENRDRFVLSKGHASAGIYAALAEVGFIPQDEILTYRKFGSKLQGHPSFGTFPGIEVSTGSLGQGLSMANGMALAAKLDKKDSRVYVLMGDGEIQEGQVWEAAMTSAHYNLGNVTAIVDRNCLQIDGNTECVMSLEPVVQKWEAFGWHVLQIDGHNINEIYEALALSKEIGEEKSKPVMILAKTIKGKGVSFMENQAGWHGKAPSEQECKDALAECGGK